ncbi:hypothetical protein QC761_500200 [Podospora bellae-mahoneyi]|uniref:Uncharacterized protein n=1 Tax=Podospora bellae-mahoneyi TaxID=2093777 RepID=A0ABR0FCA5_9PEZI|nr:hypothetical protein QC761_500200 [Podospora bellae-mahoneyi]
MERRRSQASNRPASRASTNSSHTARASSSSPSSRSSVIITTPEFFVCVQEYLKPLMAISALGCPITFALIVSPIADPAHLSHNGFKFSLETVRLLISVSWLFFTLTLGLSIFTYNQSFYNQLKVGGPPPPSSFYYRWADMVMNTLDVLCMGAFLMIALAAASYVPVVGWLAVGVVGCYAGAVTIYSIVMRFEPDGEDGDEESARAYPIASLGHAAWILRHYGYHATFIWGLFLYGLGALLWIPTRIDHSFAGFCIFIFIIGNGLGSLETAADPYITGSFVFFGLDNEEKALQNVHWVYMSIAIFVFTLRISEMTDADMALQEEEAAKKGRVLGTEAYQVYVEEQPHAIGQVAKELPFRKQYRLFHAAFAEFCYTGAQVAVARIMTCVKARKVFLGLGRHIKRGAGIITGVFGGAVVPPLLAAVADSDGG